MSLFFLAGVHGVGKTTIGSRIAQKFNYSFFASSELIKQELDIEYASDKKIDKAEYTQDALLMQLKEIKKNNCKIILDGHFCLVDKSNNIYRISEHVFEKMGIDQIILLKASPKVLMNRNLLKNGVQETIKFYECFQKEEEEYAKEFASRHNVPISVISECDIDTIERIVRRNAKSNNTTD